MFPAFFNLRGYFGILIFNGRGLRASRLGRLFDCIYIFVVLIIK